MTFGQQSGPPASAKQVQYLLALLKKQGYDGFRDARGPLGFTQRQGNGKFTSGEASALIERLLTADEEDDASTDAAAQATPAPATPATQNVASPLARFPTDVLVAELTSRGWTVTPPTRG